MRRVTRYFGYVPPLLLLIIVLLAPARLLLDLDPRVASVLTDWWTALGTVGLAVLTVLLIKQNRDLSLGIYQPKVLVRFSSSNPVSGLRDADSSGKGWLYPDTVEVYNLSSSTIAILSLRVRQGCKSEQVYLIHGKAADLIHPEDQPPALVPPMQAQPFKGLLVGSVLEQEYGKEICVLMTLAYAEGVHRLYKYQGRFVLEEDKKDIKSARIVSESVHPLKPQRA